MTAEDQAAFYNAEQSNNQWERIASLYDRHIGNTGDEVHRMFYDPIMKSMLGEINGKVIVDAGCGNGYWSREFAPLASQVIGIDVSPTLIKRAKEKNNFSNTTYTVADLEKSLPIETGSVDLVVSNLTLHYIQDLHATAAEFGRILHKDGRVLIGVEHPAVNAHYRSLDSVGKKPPELEKSVGYFERGYLRRSILGLPIYRFNRSLEDYIGSFLQNGFTLTQFREPQLTETLIKRHPSYSRIKDIPRFALMEFTKR